MKRVLVLCLLFVATLAPAQEFKPFPRANITREQWEAYFRQVSDRPNITKREFPSEHLVVFEDRESYISWAFTTPEHPAHPAWIARQPVQDARGVSMRQIGYFAGDEKPFAELFRAYQALNDKIREDFQKKSAEAK